MDRQQLEELTFEQLQVEAIRYGIKPPQDRDACLEAIAQQIERGPPSIDLMGSSTGQLPQRTTEAGCSQTTATTQVNASSSSGIAPTSTESSLMQMCSLMLEQGRQHQILMQQMFAAMNLNNQASSIPVAVPTAQSHVSDTSQQDLRPSLSSASTGQAVKLLSTHLLDFSGTEDEDVESWVNTIERVARIHGASNDILLLAATGKLKKTARKWLELNITNLIESWLYFREAVIKRFRRPVLFHVTMQKVESRRWNHMKESFHDYAMDKLVLMKNLNLPERDSIDLLINGVGSRSTRELAAALKVYTIDDFLEEMHRITTASGEALKKSPSFARKNYVAKAATTPNPKDTNQTKETFCVYCRTKGHTRDDCYKLRKKDKPTTGQPKAKATPPVAAVERQEEAAPSTSSSVVAVVAESTSRKIEINDSKLKVVFANGNACGMWALLDTGSPISLIRPSAFEKIFGSNPILVEDSYLPSGFQSSRDSPTDFQFKAINNVPIKIAGRISTTIVIQDHIDNCLTCILNNVSSNANEGELQLTDKAKGPFDVLHTDHFGPISESINGNKHILLVVDSFSRFTWLFPCKSTTSKETIKHLTWLFQNFGNPEVLISDRGTSFTSQEFANFIKPRGIKHSLIAVAAPWANGVVERINRFLKSSLRKLIEEPDSWHSWLGATQYVINNTHHSSLKASPSKLLLGYDQRSHSDSKLIRFLNDLAKTELDSQATRLDAQRLASETVDKIKAYNKEYYDKHHKKPTKYNSGDYVMIRDTSVKPGENKKFKPSYKGPYMVAKVLDKNRYVIQDIPGFNISSKPYNSILSPDRLKLWIKPVVPPAPA
ncbi:unnamed protein product [Lasius platythorax]|uniref:Integrase catalytic domain-containing protein n=1 Tax=Lasius platythorax TaxID=488582 RepID=A0AAV2P4V1_9HYME